MGKLGLPDLVVQDLPVSRSGTMSTALNALAQLLVEGAPIGEEGRFVLDLKAIRHAGARSAHTASPGPGANLRAEVRLVIAKPEEGDAENRLLEVRFDGHPGATEVERQAAALKALVGAAQDLPVGAPAGDPELDAAAARAQARLPALAAAFGRGLPLGDHVSVKAPFETDDGGIEWMWIEVTAWDGTAVRGHLDNEPLRIKRLAVGAKVEVKQAVIADYMWRKADGSLEGGESVDILRRRDSRR
jgi:uncharacterized protein YegJ (DUF2314 family)